MDPTVTGNGMFTAIGHHHMVDSVGKYARCTAPAFRFKCMGVAKSRAFQDTDYSSSKSRRDEEKGDRVEGALEKFTLAPVYIAYTQNSTM